MLRIYRQYIIYRLGLESLGRYNKTTTFLCQNVASLILIPFKVYFVPFILLTFISLRSGIMRYKLGELDSLLSKPPFLIFGPFVSVRYF